ncbi:MAG: HAMP domain-containing histidine kinase [Deltaproteobacteria bacterium]|nr:HAMP domain-containing histidine kinase [Deltaproteobacteria bacterium]
MSTSPHAATGRTTATLRVVGRARTISELVGEMAAPVNRPKLWFGIWTGYGIAIALGLIATAASFFELTPWRWAYAGLVGAKLATNTLAWFALARDRHVMGTQTLNTITDVVVLTGAIYFTGGPWSPVLPAYVILICVLSLLSNTGITLLIAGLIVGCFSTMIVLMATEVLGPTPVLGSPGTVPTVGYTVVAIAYCALVVGVPAWFAAATLRLLREREADLERRTAQMIQAATQRSQFVASMTHELRTPIHGVQGLADVIAAGVYGPVTDKQKDACASIKRSAQSLLSLVDDLLALTRAEAGKIDARPGEVDVAGLVERVSASVSWVVGTKNLAFEVDVAPDLPTVWSDERWLAHVLVNLLANAVKFTPEGGRVSVRAHERRERAAIVLAIEDTGIGIAPEDRAAIFEPFHQSEKGDTRGYGGAGLGLALVARLTDLLGAEVELDSSVGKGSTFRVIVPTAWRGRTTTQLLRPPRPPTLQPD